MESNDPSVKDAVAKLTKAAKARITILVEEHALTNKKLHQQEDLLHQQEDLMSKTRIASMNLCLEAHTLFNGVKELSGGTNSSVKDQELVQLMYTLDVQERESRAYTPELRR